MKINKGVYLDLDMSESSEFVLEKRVTHPKRPKIVCFDFFYFWTVKMFYNS